MLKVNTESNGYTSAVQYSIQHRASGRLFRVGRKPLSLLSIQSVSLPVFGHNHESHSRMYGLYKRTISSCSTFSLASTSHLIQKEYKLEVGRLEEVWYSDESCFTFASQRKKWIRRLLLKLLCVLHLASLLEINHKQSICLNFDYCK